MIRGIPLIAFAAIIDLMQFTLSMGVIGAGASVAWIPFFGQLADAAGFALAVVINACLALGFGAMLVVFTFLLGFSPWRLFPAFTELVPGVNMLPTWTIATLWVVFGKEIKKGLPVGGSLFKTLNFLPAEGHLTAQIKKAAPIAAGGTMLDEAPRSAQRSFLEEPEKISKEEFPSHLNALSLQRSVDGIRAAAQKVAIFLAVFFFAHATLIYAQTVDPVQFTVTPQVPGPHEQVLIEVAGVGSFLGDATITWQKDGTTVLSGKGERSYSFTTGGLGTPTRIHVVINSATQGTITRDFSFVPAAVNLVWEANTTVPPLYGGKALYSAGSQLKVIAFPTVVANGATVSSNNLSFQWSLNGDPVPDASGIGRSSFSFTGDQLRGSETVSVKLYFGSVQVGSASITIPAANPALVFYDRDPLRGALYDTALQNSIALTTSEVTLQAQPYFFAADSAGALAYTWQLNGTQTTGPDAAQGILTLRQAGQGAGQANVSVALQNTSSNNFLQSAQTALGIIFGQNASQTSVFGI